MVPGYGIMLNNELTDFDAVPGGANEVGPGKRPRSSMTPTLVLKDGQPFMALGSPGGATIINSVAQVILNVIEHKQPIQEAITTPRIYSGFYPDVQWEAGIDQDVILQLMAKGHAFREQPGNIGNVQAVIYDYETGMMYGGADTTREGTVLGVDNVSFTVDQPAEATPVEKGPFSVKVNGYVYPFTAEQLVIEDGISYVQADKLLLGLGADPTQFAQVLVTINGKAFLPIKQVAEDLGYNVSWDGSDNVVSLDEN
jgi:gamma-glutamyltranspeptidase/glutathione hydrolase